MSRPRKQTRIANGVNAVLYIRVSTKEQGKQGRYGVDAQLTSMLDYCQKRGYTIVGTCSDIGKSGTLDTLDRPGLTDCMCKAKTRIADVIVAAAQDRLARDSGIFDDIRTLARRDGYRLETVKESMDMAAEENEITGDAMAFVASIERKNIAKRTLAGRKERAKIDGRSSSSMPYGYKVVNDEIVIDKYQAEIIRFILNEREAGRPYQEIADRLRYNGDRKPNGGTDWNVGNVQTIEKREQLYRYGIREWGGIKAQETWPKIM